MSIKEIMQIGTDGMSKAEIQGEQERRLKVVERINYISEMVKRINIQLEQLPASCKVCKIWKNRRNRYNREIKRIKADEGSWLRDVAWFMYA